MPNDANSRGVSAVTGFVLFLALIEIAYTNATYSGVVGSIPIAIATALIGLAMFLKFAHAVGASYKAMEFFERLLFWVPFLTVGISVIGRCPFTETVMKDSWRALPSLVELGLLSSG